jgi:hypothetical protein
VHMVKRPKKKPREKAVMKTVIARHEGPGATVVPGVTDEDPNTGRRIEKKKKR